MLSTKNLTFGYSLQHQFNFPDLHCNAKQTLLILVSTLVLSSCKTFLTIPNYVSSKELASLTIGSTKNQVKTKKPYNQLLNNKKNPESRRYPTFLIEGGGVYSYMVPMFV